MTPGELSPATEAALLVMTACTLDEPGWFTPEVLEVLADTYSPYTLHEAFRICDGPPTGNIDAASRGAAVVLLAAYELARLRTPNDTR